MNSELRNYFSILSKFYFFYFFYIFQDKTALEEIEKIKFQLKDKLLLIISDNSSYLDEKLESFIGVKKKEFPIVNFLKITFQLLDLYY